jgi:hypothetical protein
MSAVITTTEFVLSAARAAYGSLKRVKGQRPLAVLDFLNADSDEARDNVVAEWGAGFVRRGLREAAVYFDGKDDAEVANAFWTLRDSIDEDGFLNADESEVAGDDES